KNGSLYDVHSYWSKKPYLAIERFISHYTQPDDIVLDPFCGCGSTLQAALGLGRKAIGIDLNPSATHIAANTLSYVNQSTLNSLADKILRDLKKVFDALYTISISGKNYIISSFIHAEQVRCIKCLRFFSILQPHTSKPRSACPHCEQSFSTRSRNTEFGPDEIVAVELRNSHNSRRGKLFWLSDEKEIAKQLETQDAQKKAEKIRNLLDYPMPQRLIDFGGRLSTTGSTTIGKLFDDRAIYTLYALRQEITKIEDFTLRGKLLLAFTAILKNCSKMYRFHEGGGGSPIGAYYVPPIRKEINPFFAFKDKVSAILKSLQEISEWEALDFCVSTQSSCDINIPSNSIDYIFTDPPYADTMPFGALNFIWDSWLDPSWGWESQEAISENWKPKLLQIFKEVYRVAKPGAYCSVCYHDTSEGTWQDLIDIMAEAGFQSVIGKDVLFIETTQQAYQQTVADKVVKRDHVVNFRKPVPGEVSGQLELTGNEDISTFNEKIRSIIRDYLGSKPGSTKDRIYDDVVGRMVSIGQMEAHDFNELLLQVAEEAKIESGKNDGSRWYLKDTELVIADAAETAREDVAAEKLGAFIKGFLKKNPGDEGVHYSNLFEHYIYAVKDKPRRQLSEFLPDYFYKTEQGTWRLPASEEEEKAKREARVKGLGRRVKRYIAQLEQGAIISDYERPNDATLAEWIRHCKRAGLYEQGKLLYEKGGLNPDNLSEEAMVNVEEDYQVCARILARTQADGSAKTRKKG
ncbi:MAG: hypothetical protein GX602_02475, partial [Dehalococcoidales bacterium]|nr:hypothetical protein [Dehalococcoidales bacterium]